MIFDDFLHSFTLYTVNILLSIIDTGILEVHIYQVCFYHRTLRDLRNDELPTLEPGTRSWISARFMAPGQETPRARRGGAPRARGRSSRPSGDVCAEPLRLEGSPETRGVPSSGAAFPERNVFGGWHR